MTEERIAELEKMGFKHQFWGMTNLIQQCNTLYWINQTFLIRIENTLNFLLRNKL